MTRFSTIRLFRPSAIGAAVIAVAAAMWAQPGSAQDARTLQPLLEQLLGAPGAGLQAGGAGGALDAARAGAAGGAAVSPLAAAGVPDVRRSTSVLTPEELIIVSRFCEDRLRGAPLDLLTLVPAFSPLEQDYCTRAGEPLLQFGDGIFDAPRTPQVLVNGAIPENYRLGIGDEIVITFRGQISLSTSAVVDREGRIILADMDPISAAGRTFGDFRGELEARVDAAFRGTEVFASLGAVRLVSVSVVGEVHAPGVHQLTGLSTILDAISRAGGIKKTGSLRRISVQRAGTIFWIDMYDLL